MKSNVELFIELQKRVNSQIETPEGANHADVDFLSKLGDSLTESEIGEVCSIAQIEQMELSEAEHTHDWYQQVM